MKKFIFNKFKSSPSGFSLVEIMVAAGMLAAISVAVMNVMSNATKTQKKMSVDNTINEVASDIRNILRDELDCTEAFKNLPFPTPVGQTPNANRIVRYRRPPAAGTPVTTYTIGDTIGSGADNAWITNMTLKLPQVVDPTNGTAILVVSFSRFDQTKLAPLTAEGKAKFKADRMYGSEIVPKEFKVNFFTQAGTIRRCAADLADYQQQMCETALQGQWDAAAQKCRAIKIENAPGGRVQAIEADDLKVMDGMQIGGPVITAMPGDGLGINTAPTGAGNLNMTGRATIAGGATITGPDITANTTTNITLTSPSIALNGSTAITGPTLTVNNTASTTITSPTTTVNSTTTINGNTRVNGLTYLNGNTTVVAPGTALAVTGSGIAMTVNGGKVFLSNPPAVSHPVAGGERSFVPTAGWVEDYMRHNLAATVASSNANIVGELVAAMANYANNKPMDAVANYVCGKMQINDKDGNKSIVGRPCANLATPDTRCDTWGKCSQVCIGGDCRGAWPVDTRCDTAGTCNRLCIGWDCRTAWPTLRGVNGCYVAWSACSANTVMFGLIIAGAPTFAHRPICCQLIIK